MFRAFIIFCICSFAFSLQAQTQYLSDIKTDTILANDREIFFTLPYDIADENSANRFFSDANYQYQTGNLVYAANLMKKAIKKQPNRYEYYQLQAFILMDLGDHKNSVKHAERAVLLHPGDWKMLYCLALTKYAAKDFLGANIEYSRALELAPGQYLLYEGRAHTKTELNDPLGALSDFDLAVMIKPTYIKAYQGRGQVNFKLGKYREAVADFTSVLLREPSNANALYLRGISRKMLGDMINACSDFEKSSKLGKTEAYKELKNTCSK
jgi:tetratricopeptide (TPR) repeat protein